MSRNFLGSCGGDSSLSEAVSYFVTWDPVMSRIFFNREPKLRTASGVILLR